MDTADTPVTLHRFSTTPLMSPYLLALAVGYMGTLARGGVALYAVPARVQQLEAALQVRGVVSMHHM